MHFLHRFILAFALLVSTGSVLVAQFDYFSLGVDLLPSSAAETYTRVRMGRANFNFRYMRHLSTAHVVGGQIGHSRLFAHQYVDFGDRIYPDGFVFEDKGAMPLDMNLIYQFQPSNSFFLSTKLGLGIWKERLFADIEPVTYFDSYSGYSVTIPATYFDYDFNRAGAIWGLGMGLHGQFSNAFFIELECGYSLFALPSQPERPRGINYLYDPEDYYTSYFSPRLTYGTYHSFMISLRLGLRRYNGK
jgi:hypothetical protein